MASPDASERRETERAVAPSAPRSERTQPGPSAKRMRVSPPCGLKPELVFKELIVDQVQWNRNDNDKFSAHADTNHNLFVSDTNRIVCYDRDGKYQPLLSNIEPHHIVPNSTADFVVLLRKSDKQKLSKVDAKGNVATILETQAPLYGPDVCPNGDVVHHPSQSRLERRSPSNELVASIEGGRGKVISFEANSYLTAGQDGNVYFSSKTCVYRRDGFASDARFTHLKRPVLTKRFAYVRENDNRFCRINLETFEVSTLHLRLPGIQTDGIETYGVTPDGRMMFLIYTVPFRIFTAETTDALESTFCSDMRRVDWTATSGARVDVEFVAGRDRRVFRADGRILEARSAFFRSMLVGGMREALTESPIELGEDVNGDALEALLHFLHTDQFEPVSPPEKVTRMVDEEVLKLAKFTIDVFTLADRFLLPRLARLCEVFLSECTLRSATVIPVLASIKSPRRPTLFNLEAACWDFLEEHWKEVLQHTANLEEIITNQHPLVLELLKASRGVKRTARKPDDETPAA